MSCSSVVVRLCLREFTAAFSCCHMMVALCSRSQVAATLVRVAIMVEWVTATSFRAVVATLVVVLGSVAGEEEGEWYPW
jgi:hypothetical protein